MVFFLLEKNTCNFDGKEGYIMPKTKTQNLVFTLMTAILMAYFMIAYSISINSADGLVNKTFLIALKEFPIEGIIVFLLAFFVASPIAKKMAFKIVNPKNDNKMFVILSIQTFTVLVMVGLMSIYALFAQHLINSNFICNYIVLYCKNFMMAYPLQIFFVGPLVRRVFRMMFKKQL
jgi:hypothetical protein